MVDTNRTLPLLLPAMYAIEVRNYDWPRNTKETERPCGDCLVEFDAHSQLDARRSADTSSAKKEAAY